MLALVNPIKSLYVLTTAKNNTSLPAPKFTPS
ncbi:hypothetical protein PSHT_13593 [Puccinia striiformis]|uniref:Uncharacterized protein n=1 Tax=Puccinia striiformis TaxID=27350 RepID=A0A2S4UQ24_9BASI|nr:hypothetical protein PSHT_13593 [Puccinia striiformis]